MSAIPQTRIPVYLMPGLAAGPSIFENIQLPEDQFELHYLEWFVPEQGMSLQTYAEKMAEKVKGEQPVLLGVSFGGVLVQEMAHYLDPLKVIIVSSIKNKKELPRRLMLARYTGLHKLLPTGLINNVELLARYAFGETVNKRLKLYEQYLGMRDKYYLDWSIDKMVNWQQDQCREGLVHIHGDNDAVFPKEHLEDCIFVKGGTHTMILHRARWFNEHLPEIILK